MDSRLIERFFNKTCTTEEALQVLEWFSSQKVQNRHENDLFQIWEIIEKEKKVSPSVYDPEEMLAVIHQQIDEKNKLHRITVRRETKSADWLPNFLKGAAVLFFITLFAWLFVDGFEKEEKEKVPNIITLEAPAGIKLTKVLPDGSKVILNSGSFITYTEGFSENKRELTLAGEGYFEVVRDPLRPFTVHSGKVSTTAVGTSFNIKHQPEGAVSEVSLASGKVQVRVVGNKDVKTQKLLPGERLKYRTDVDSVEVDQFDEGEVLAWKDGILYFKETTLDQVVQRLENWYGVNISLEGNPVWKKNKEWTYTGRYENESLDNVLTGIGFVKDFNFEINGKDVKIMFN